MDTLSLNLYNLHKSRTTKRTDRAGNKIMFLMTYEEWRGVWLASGAAHLKGRKRGQYCMSRYDDLGNYEVSNVFIQLHSENARQGQFNRSFENKSAAQRGKKLSDEHRAKISAAAKARPGPNTGRTLSAEHRAKISAAMTGNRNAANQLEKHQTDIGALGTLESSEIVTLRIDN